MFVRSIRCNETKDKMKKQAEELIKMFLEANNGSKKGAVKASIVHIGLKIEDLNKNIKRYSTNEYIEEASNLMGLKFMLETMLIFE